MKKLFTMILALVVSLSSLIFLTSCNGSGNDTTVEIANSKQIGEHFIVNNAMVDTAASDSHTIVDDKTGIAYTAYLASEGTYGESSEILKVAKYSIMQPTNVQWLTVFDYEKDFGGAHISTCNVLDLDTNTIRLLVLNKENNIYYYKDVDKKTFTVGEMGEVKYRRSSLKQDGPVTMSVDNVNAHILDLGGEAFNYVQISSDILKIDGYFYATISGGKANSANFLFAESPDGITWKFVSLIKHRVSYEAMLAHHDNKFWIFCRDGATNPTTETYQNLLYSSDNGKTWTLSNLALTVSDTRPYIFEYQKELYIAYSSPMPRDYSVVRNWRCNLHIGKVTSKDGKETYEEIIYKESKFGIVYFSLIDWYGKMIMLYSSGELFPEKGAANWQTQAKDCMNYTILQEVDPELKIKQN